MHLTLTDHLTCPRCGPTVGLILLMERADERRVIEGALGCPVCRTQYRIANRIADLRGTATEEGQSPARDADASAGQDPEQLALRVAASLAPGAERGFVFLDGPLALSVGAALRAYVPDQELVLCVEADEAKEAGRVEASSLLAGVPLPIADRTMRGAAYVGGVPSPGRLAELLRVVRPTGRLAVDVGAAGDALEGLAEALVAGGARLKARDATALVAVVL